MDDNKELFKAIFRSNVIRSLEKYNYQNRMDEDNHNANNYNSRYK